MSRSKGKVPTKRSYHKDYIHVKYKTLALIVEMLQTRSKFSKSRQTKRSWSYKVIPTDRSCHKENSC